MGELLGRLLIALALIPFTGLMAVRIVRLSGRPLSIEEASLATLLRHTVIPSAALVVGISVGTLQVAHGHVLLGVTIVGVTGFAAGALTPGALLTFFIRARRERHPPQSILKTTSKAPPA